MPNYCKSTWPSKWSVKRKKNQHWRHEQELAATATNTTTTASPREFDQQTNHNRKPPGSGPPTSTPKTSTTPSSSAATPPSGASSPPSHSLPSVIPPDEKRWHETLEQGRPRWLLHLQASMWRQLSNAGFALHRSGPPSPPPPSFSRSIPITVSPRKNGEIVLQFWTPPGYTPGTSPKRYPVVINFHGGGFTIGTAIDDCRWGAVVVNTLDCIYISVEYRLAPEHPFPTAVEDGADACLWLIDHAEELAIDPQRIATSGFSAGGNMAFTVCMRTRHEVELRRKARGIVTPDATSADMEGINPGKVLTEPPQPSDSDKEIHEGKIVAIASFYPSSDFTLPREVRRLSILRRDKGLPAFFTDLFDASYLHPPKSIHLDNIYLSPGIAPTNILRDSLPQDIILYTCEWDELLVEGERFAQRLQSEEVGKNVKYKCVMGARHGWDKSPWPWDGDDQHRVSVYREVCQELGRVFYGEQWRIPKATKGEDGNGNESGM